MSIIKLDNFGGLAPSVSQRALPAGLAASNHNLFAPMTEFKPLADDRTVAFTLLDSNPVTLYKRQRITINGAYLTEAQGWYTATIPVSLVKSQIDDDATERIYMTADDGSSAPQAWDVLGVLKPLGVTPPSTAPTVTHNAVAKYTVAEDTFARQNLPLKLTEACVQSATVTMMGPGQTVMTAGASEGWLLHTTSVSVAKNPATVPGEYAYCALMTSGANGYTVDANHQWMTAASLRGVRVTYGGYVYWAIPIMLQGTGFTVNAATLTTKLKDVLSPDPDFSRTVTTGYTGTDPTKQLIDDAACTASASEIAALYAVTTEPQNTHIAGITTAQNAVISAVSNYGSTEPGVAALKDFYATTAAATYINGAIATFAARISAKLQQALFVDAGSWGMGSWSTINKDGVIPLFPSTFTPATCTGAALLEFGADGVLAFKTDAIISSIESLLTTRVSTGTGTEVVSVPYVVNETMKWVQDSYLKDLVAAITTTKLKASSLSFPAQDTETSRISAVVTAIAQLKTAVQLVTEDYNSHNAYMKDKINEIALGEAGFIAAMPEPQNAIYDSRVYLTTWVTTWGEESAPSLPSVLLDKVDTESDTVVVSRPVNTVSAELQAGWRLYRSNSGTDKTAFQLVVGKAGDTGAVFDGDTFLYFDKTLATFTDNRSSKDLGEVIPSVTWLKPDSRLKGLTGMANGMMAGFYDNVICFSEAYTPYAWPIEYQLTVKYPIVGIAAFGSNLFVLTRGSPYLLTGSDPASISATEMPSNQACVSARSICAVEMGVLYASPDGVCYADTSGVQVITQGIIARDLWQQLNPSTIFGVVHEGVYYMRNDGATGDCLALDMVAKKLVTLDLTASAFFVDKITDTLFAASGTTLKALFNGTGKRTAVYKTGIINVGKATPMAWLQVFSDFSASVEVKWYGDGVLRHTATVTSIEPVRLPSGRYTEHQIEITSAARITSLVVCGSTVELKQV